ncbi:MAG: MlaD family protein [Rickettsiales bacterium]
MKDDIFEAILGVIIIIFCILVLFFFNNKYQSNNINLGNKINIVAEFNNVEGILVGSEIKISGVKVGIIKDINLNKDNFKVTLTLELFNNFKIPNDSTAAIRTGNLAGGKYIEIIIGSEEEYLKEGDLIPFTQSSIIFEDILSKFLLQYNKN